MDEVGEGMYLTEVGEGEPLVEDEVVQGGLLPLLAASVAYAADGTLRRWRTHRCDKINSSDLIPRPPAGSRAANPPGNDPKPPKSSAAAGATGGGAAGGGAKGGRREGGGGGCAHCSKAVQDETSMNSTNASSISLRREGGRPPTTHRQRVRVCIRWSAPAIRRRRLGRRV